MDSQRTESLDQKSVEELKEENQLLRVKIKGVLFSIILQILSVINVIALPLFVVVVFALIDVFVNPIPVITFDPTSVQLQGEGLKITWVIIGIGILTAAKNLITLSTKSYPVPQISEVGDNHE